MALHSAAATLERTPPATAGGSDPAPPADAPTPFGRRSGRARSEMAGLAALLVATAAAYLWNLTASGYANSFYAAAVEAGTKSWKAFFFGSLDSSNFITVDKPPASLWVMELSGRLFGFSSASMLVPQALEGVATVALVYAVVRRWFGHRFGLLAGAVMAATPVAALMFRFDNPDALLVLLMTLGAYGMTRALEKGSTRWLVLTGTALGFAFLTKMGQALLVVPGFAVAYAVAGPVAWRRRIGQLLAAGAAMVVAAGWWVLTVTLWPAASRPMIDGSPKNSIWNLIVAYNGLDRLSSSSGPGGGGGSFSGATGPFRLFNSLMGGQASWLLPAAAVALVGGLVVTARRPRTDRTRAALIMWGGWLVVTGAVFSFGQGIIHTYYTVALAPAIAVLVGIGAALVGQHWRRPAVRVAAAATIGLTAWWACSLLDRTPDWNPWLRPVIAAGAVVGAGGLLAVAACRSTSVRKAVATAALLAAGVAVLGGPTAYALDTINTAHTGSVPSAGPSGASTAGAPGGASTGGAIVGGPGHSGGGEPAGGQRGAGQPGGGRTGGAGQPGGGGQPGGAGQVSSALVKALASDASHYRWVAATDGSSSAASYELATGGDAVMAIGGFNGQGGNLTLAQFEKYVEAGDIHYYIAGGQGGGPGGGSSSSAITSWVESHFKSETIGGTTVYDLTSEAG